MKLLVFADSHGRTLEMHAAIAQHQPDAILHLGDYYRDAQELKRAYPEIPLYAVRGNNDWDDARDVQVVTLGEVRIYMCHGHLARCHGRHVENLPSLARRENCTLALYGHTHCINLVQQDDLTILNCGSITRPRGSAAGYATVVVDAGEIQNITLHNPND